MKRKKQQILYVHAANEESLEQGAREIGEMLSDLETSLARREKRGCIICPEEEWMDPDEDICWKCNRCIDALKALSRPLTQRSSSEHRALHEVLNWMQSGPRGLERSPQEIANYLEELRASYTWSSGMRCTKQDRYQNRVLNLLHLALHDMDLFFRRLPIVQQYYNQLKTDTGTGGF